MVFLGCIILANYQSRVKSIPGHSTLLHQLYQIRVVFYIVYFDQLSEYDQISMLLNSYQSRVKSVFGHSTLLHQPKLNQSGLGLKVHFDDLGVCALSS